VPDAAIVIHSLGHAVAALNAAAEADREIVLLSAPEAGIYAGAGWFKALVAAARAAVPAAEFLAMLDCGDDAGAAMAAIRAGIADVVYTGRRDVAERLAAIAAAHGARCIAARPAPLIDLADDFFADPETLHRRCAAALAAGEPDQPSR
jgi:hypothetical protein